MERFNFYTLEEKIGCGYRNFSGTDLTGIPHPDRKCDKYEFRGSDMRGSIFNYTEFNKCDFSGADLRGSRFYGVKLSECNFSGADLRGTRFCKCEIDNATIFKGATVSGIYFDNMEIPLEISSNSTYYI